MESLCFSLPSTHVSYLYLFLQAYFECGMVKLRAGNSKGVLDLNQALAINPQFFQVLQMCIVSVICNSTFMSFLLPSKVPLPFISHPPGLLSESSSLWQEWALCQGHPEL